MADDEDSTVPVDETAGMPCLIYEYDGAYRCTTHDRMWGALPNPEQPCESKGALMAIDSAIRELREAADKEPQR